MSTLFERASQRIPGGVNSPVRAFGGVGGEPFFAARGEGAYLCTADGRRLVDYVQSWGATILGHAYPKIVEAVQAAASEGTSFGIPTEREVQLAERVCDIVPSVEKLRLVSSGTEAGMTAVRLARGATGRDVIVKFAGCYHGHFDSMLVAAGSGVATLGLEGASASSAGVTAGAVHDTVVLPYNDLVAIDAVFDAYPGSVAAVIVEPVAANMGLVAPAPGFLEGLRERCSRNESVLIFDEVITGFRVAAGGAQQLFGVAPDLSIFGKVLGGGLPLAAVGGSAAMMDHLAPLGSVYQAGTLSGNPLATAAGLAALDALDAAAYRDLAVIAGRLERGIVDAAAAHGVTVQVTRVETLVGLFFADRRVQNYDDAKQADHERYARMFHALLDEGVYFAPSGYETLFPGLAHGDAELELTAAALTAAVA